MHPIKASLKLPGQPKNKKNKTHNTGNNTGVTEVTSIHAKDLRNLLGKGVYPCYLDFSPSFYRIENEEFLLSCPNSLKELDLTGNAFIQITSLQHLSKLKRLYLDSNYIVNMVFTGLSSLVYLSVANNLIRHLGEMSDLKHLVYFDLGGNRIESGLDELGKLKALRVLDLSNNSLDFDLDRVTSLLDELKRLPKLEFLSFIGNPVETKIIEFKHYVMNELPRLKYLDWQVATKEDRVRAARMSVDGLWTNPQSTRVSPQVSVHVQSRVEVQGVLNNGAPYHPTRDHDDMLDQMLAEFETGANSATLSSSELVEKNEIDSSDPLDALLDELAPPFASPQMSAPRALVLPETPLNKSYITPVVYNKSLDNDFLALVTELTDSVDGNAGNLPDPPEDILLPALDDALDIISNAPIKLEEEFEEEPEEEFEEDAGSAVITSSMDGEEGTNRLFELEMIIQEAGLTEISPLPILSSSRITTQPRDIAPSAVESHVQPVPVFPPPHAQPVASSQPGPSGSSGYIDDLEAALNDLEASIGSLDSFMPVLVKPKIGLRSQPSVAQSKPEPQPISKKPESQVLVPQQHHEPIPLPTSKEALREPELTVAQPKPKSEPQHTPMPLPSKKTAEAAVNQPSKSEPAPSPPVAQRKLPPVVYPKPKSKLDVSTPPAKSEPPAVQTKPEPSAALPKPESVAVEHKPELPASQPKIEQVEPEPPAPQPKIEPPPAQPKLEPVVSHKAEPVAPPQPAPQPKMEPPSAQPKLEPVVSHKAEPVAPPQPAPQPKIEPPVAPPEPEPVVTIQEPVVLPPSTEVVPPSTGKLDDALDELLNSFGIDVPEPSPTQPKNTEMRHLRQNSGSSVPSDVPPSQNLTRKSSTDITAPLSPFTPTHRRKSSGNNETRSQSRLNLGPEVFSSPPLSRKSSSDIPSGGLIPVPIRARPASALFAPAPAPAPTPTQTAESLVTSTVPIPPRVTENLEKPPHVETTQPASRSKSNIDIKTTFNTNSSNAFNTNNSNAFNANTSNAFNSNTSITPNINNPNTNTFNNNNSLNTNTNNTSPHNKPYNKNVSIPASHTPDLKVGGNTFNPPATTNANNVRPIVIPKPVQTPEVEWKDLIIKEKLGNGAFGDLHVGQYRGGKLSVSNSFGFVTVKKIRMQRFADGFLTMFRGEVRTLSTAVGTNFDSGLVPLLAGCTETTICAIYAYTQGCSLQDMIAPNQNTAFVQPVTPRYIAPLPGRLVLSVARQVAASLMFLHSRNIIHRSLKPGNIMVDYQEKVYLRDYGFCTIKDAILKAGQAPSPYMAPELQSGTLDAYDAAIDIFSFGMVLWAAFTGKIPFDGEHPKRITELILAGERPPLDIPIPVYGTIPTAFSRLIGACWAHDPTTRPSLDIITRILGQLEEKLLAVPPVAPRGATAGSQNFPQQIPAVAKAHTVVHKIVEALMRRHSDELERACRVLETLAQEEIICVMVDEGIHMYLLDHLNIRSDPALALSTLSNLSEYEEFAAAIVKTGIPPLKELLHPRNVACFHAVKLVSTLASHSDLCEPLQNAGIVHSLVLLLQSDSSMWLPNDFYDLETQTVKALLRLLPLGNARNDFIELGGPAALIPMLVLQSTKNFHLHSRIVSALGSMLISNTSGTPITIQTQSNLSARDAAVPNLVSTMVDDDEVLATNACAVVATLLPESCVAFAKAAVDEGLDIGKSVVRMVNLLVRDGQLTDDVSVKSVLQILATILAPDADIPTPITIPSQLPEILCENQGVGKLVMCLSSNTQQVREEAVRVLSWITTNPTVRQKIVVNNGLRILFSQAVSASTLNVQERTIAMVTHFAADTNYDAIHNKLVEGGAIQVAVHFLGCEDVVLLSLALKAVLLLIQHPQCKNHIIQAGGKEYLNMHVTSSARSIQLASRKALTMLDTS